jgi:hypothetical protein
MGVADDEMLAITSDMSSCKHSSHGYAGYKALGKIRKLDLKERNHIILHKPSPIVMQRLRTSVNNRLKRVCFKHYGDGEHSSACRILKDATQTQERARRISTSFSIDKQNRWEMNFGVPSMLVRDLLTKDQKYGLMHRGWHLSYLCGNWKYLNHRHYTVEPARTNQERKACFNAGRCKYPHNPRCKVGLMMKRE